MNEKAEIKTKINGNEVNIEQQQLEQNLLQFLREDLDLTGAKNGCGIGVCGACTVLIDNVAARACKKQIKDIIDREVLTIEGLSNKDKPDELHPLQQAFVDAGCWVRPFGKLIYVMPPLVINDAQLEKLTTAMVEVIRESA